MQLPSGFQFITQLSPYFTTGYFTSSTGFGDPFLVVGSSLRLDGLLSLEAPDGRWAVDLIGKNLTDRNILTAVSLTSATKQQPRNVAVQFRYYF